MKVKLLKGILTVLSLICILCIPVSPVYAEPQGTNGTEVQVMEPEKLEIQLGADWVGVEFQLKTDAGMYPGTIKVGEDGVLRTELGGSKSYVLTCINSDIDTPKPTQAPARAEKVQDETQKDNGADVEDESNGTIAGIPITHIVLFGGGMVLAVGSLVVMQVMKKRREANDEYVDEDEYDE